MSDFTKDELAELSSLIARLKSANIPYDDLRIIEAEDGSEVAVVIPDGAVGDNDILEDVDVFIVPSSPHWDANLLIEAFLSLPYYLDKYAQQQKNNFSELDRIISSISSLIIILKLSSKSNADPNMSRLFGTMALLLKQIISPSVVKE